MQEQYAITKWAQVLGVSTSGYYDWLKERALRQKKDDKIRRKVIDLFKREGQGTYGAERICGCMRRDGLKASFAVVKCILRRAVATSAFASGHSALQVAGS